MSEETSCGDELHDLYPHSCPACNPDAYALLLEQAPEGVVGTTEEKVDEQGPSTHSVGYSDRY